MVKPLFTVRDFRTELSDEVADAGELLRNYEFNISQGIVQRVSRCFDALALMDERGEAPPARGEGGKYADSARGGVMGFGHKRNVGNQEKKPARRVAWEQQVDPAVKAETERIQKEAEEAAAAAAREAAEQGVEMAALKAQVAAAAAREAAGQDAEIITLRAEAAAAAARKAAEQDTKMAALEAKVAEMQALAAPTAALRPIWPTPSFAPFAPFAPSAPSAPKHPPHSPTLYTLYPRDWVLSCL